MYDHKTKFAVCDANVLIDYFMADEDILRETSIYWRRLCVPDIILQEVKLLSQERAQELGLDILPTPFAEILTSPSLSLQDSSCLYFAEKMSAICISNDKSLRNACLKKGLDIVWGLEMILFLIMEKQISKNRGKDVAIKIHNSNPEINDGILSDFLDKLKAI